MTGTEDMKSDEDIGIVYVNLDGGEIPPLDEHAKAILDAMTNAGEPLSRRQLLEKTGVPSSAWSRSLGLLMTHDLVEVGRCKKRGDVFRCKGREEA